MKSLQFCLKYLQEQGLCSIDGSFDCSSIDKSVLIKSINHPNIISQMSSGIYSRPNLSPSRNNSLEGTKISEKLESNSSNFSYLNSDSPSLASSREESDSLLG